MNCNKHFDFQQFFNGKLCCKIHDLLSVQIIFFWIGLLDAISSICYICVAPMKLCPLMWHRVWLICNIKGCFHLTMIFNKRWLSSLFNGLVAVNFMVHFSWIRSFDVRSLNSCKPIARWILCHYWLLREIVWLFQG